MRSFQLVQFGAPLEAHEAPTPKPSGREVLVRIRAAGVCHSDLHICDGYYDIGHGAKLRFADRGVKLPLTIGHEIMGEVAALGPEAEGVKVGDRRLVYSWLGCGTCPVCRQGDENLCTKPSFFGAFRNGGYSDYLIVPDSRYLVDVDGIPDGLAATCACAGVTAYNGVRRAGPFVKGDWLVLIGAGGVGQMGIGFAKAMTEAELLVVDLDDAKLEAARKAGVRHVLNPRQGETAKRIVEMTGGGAMAAIDFVGATETARLAIDGVRKAGRVVIIGLYGGALDVPLPFIPVRNLTIRGSYVGNLAETRAVVDLMRSGKVAPLPVDTRPLAEANAALTELREGRIKGRVALTP
ncbi:MAG: alcohol dehydrogenase [Alphaproteobacteria bacterium]